MQKDPGVTAQHAKAARGAEDSVVRGAGGKQEHHPHATALDRLQLELQTVATRRPTSDPTSTASSRITSPMFATVHQYNVRTSILRADVSVSIATSEEKT